MLLIGVGTERKTRWARGRLAGVPYFPPKGNGLPGSQWSRYPGPTAADRSAIIERQREGAMLAFGNQEEEIR